jgi:hypothetical protein
MFGQLFHLLLVPLLLLEIGRKYFLHYLSQILSFLHHLTSCKLVSNFAEGIPVEAHPTKKSQG